MPKIIIKKININSLIMKYNSRHNIKIGVPSSKNALLTWMGFFGRKGSHKGNCREYIHV